VKAFRLRRLNAAEAEARQGSGRQGPVEQANQEPQGEQRSRPLWSVRRRSSRSSGVSQRDGPVRSQMLRTVDQNRLRRRVTSKVLRLSSSARRRPWERVNRPNLVEAHHQKPVSRPRLRPVEHIQMKRAPNEKECRSRAVTLSRRSRPSASRIIISSSSNNNEAPRLPQPIMARDTGSRKAETSDNRKKRRRPGRTNFGACNTSGSGTAFVCACQSPFRRFPLESRESRQRCGVRRCSAAIR
jgi:hypothetical protein